MKPSFSKLLFLISLVTTTNSAHSQIGTEKVWASFSVVPEVIITDEGLESTDPELYAFIVNNNVVSIKQALPSSRKEELLRVYEIECNCDAVDLMIAITESNLGITKPEIAPKYELLYDPNDYNAVFGTDYALDLINAKGAWNFSKGDANTLIGISDANYHLGNVDLANKYLSFSSPNTNQNYAHGTAVALTAAGDTDNNEGKSSIGFNCMMHLRSISYNNILDLSYNGCRVINCSWMSGCMHNDYSQGVIDEVYDNGSIVVCAAGNGSTCGGASQLVYPAAYERTIAVSSIGPYDNHERVIGDSETTHQHNSSVDLCAPGYDIASGITWTFGPSFINGSSFASPYVSGTIGLMLSIRPCLTYEEVLDILKTSAVNIDAINPGYVGLLGSGRLDAGSALRITSSLPACDNFELYSEDNDGYLDVNDENDDTNLGFGINNGTQPNVTLYPNPTNGITNVAFDEIRQDQMTVKIIDMTGKVIFENEVNSENDRLRIDLIQKGIFLVEIESNEQVVWQEKLVRY